MEKTADKPMNKHQIKSAHTRAQLIDVFCDLYRQMPLERITVREITERVGCNRSTFYQYFHDTYDILNALELEAIKHAETSMQATMASGNIAEEFPQAFMQLCYDNADLFRLLLSGSNAHKFVDSLKAETAFMIKTTLAPAASERNVQVDYLIDFYLAGVLDILTKWARGEEEVSAQAVGAVIQGILNQGILPTLEAVTQ